MILFVALRAPISGKFYKKYAVRSRDVSNRYALPWSACRDPQRARVHDPRAPRDQGAARRYQPFARQTACPRQSTSGSGWAQS